MFTSFNRFSLEMPLQAALDCSHQGACDDDVDAWKGKIVRPADITPDKLRDELREYGAWDDEQLADDDDNWQRLIWIAGGNIREHMPKRDRRADLFHWQAQCGVWACTECRHAHYPMELDQEDTEDACPDCGYSCELLTSEECAELHAYQLAQK